MADTDEPLSLYVRQFEEAELQSLTARQESEKARDYYDDKQLTAEEEKKLKKRGQPIIWENLIKPKIETLCGLERQSRVDPVAYPRVPSKEQDANAATDALRYVEQDQNLDIARSRVFQYMLIEGYGGVEVGVRQQKSGTIDPSVTLIAWDRLYYDPHSSELDFADATFTGYVTWMDMDEALRRWPDKADVLQATKQRGTSALTNTYDDRPKHTAWYDSKRQRIRINTHYHLLEGVWNRCVFTLGGELEDSEPSAYLDDEGNPENPLILQSAYVDRDNDRYGIVRSMIPLQDEVNKRRSKFLHMVNSNRWRVSKATGIDVKTAKAELAKPDGIISADPGDVESLDQAIKDSGQFTLYQSTVASLKGNIGPNAYLSGKTGESQSGKAVLAQQQAGMTEMAPLLDSLRHFNIRLYRQIWNRIRQYWTDERWIRVTDDKRNVRFVGLNRPPQMDQMTAMAAHQSVDANVQQGQLDPQTAQQYHAQIQDMATPSNVIGELDVDIDIDEMNETPTIQAEQFEQLATLIGQTPMLAQNPEVIEVLIEASSLRDKDKLITILKQGEQSQQQNPMQQLEVGKAQGDIAKVQGESAKISVQMSSEQQRARLFAAQADEAELKVQLLRQQLASGVPPFATDKIAVGL